MLKVSFIGAGNVAFRTAIAMCEADISVDYIYNRNAVKGAKLASVLQKNGSDAHYTDSLSNLLTSDLIIIAVSDDAIIEVVEKLRICLNENPQANPVVAHTSGATDMAEIAMRCDYGVFYPLMSLNRNKEIDYSKVPLFLEGSSKRAEKLLEQTAQELKSEYLICDSQKRLQMHTAAVFATNFVNVMLSYAKDISQKEFTLLLPATIEMVRKSFLIDPDPVLTGPAKRGDTKTLEKHIALLEAMGLNEQKEIYELITKNIINKHKK